MRHDRIIAAAVARQAPSIFICTCCDLIEHTNSNHAPHDWAIEFIDGNGYPLCPDCQDPAPAEHFPAGATATRLGVVSTLDAAELLEWDEEDYRQAQMLAGLARAEHIGNRVFPMLLAAIALGLTLSTLSQGYRWMNF